MSGKPIDRETLSREFSQKDREAFNTITMVKKGVHYHEFNGKKYDVDTFYKELYFEEVTILQRRLVHRIFRFNQNDFKCPMCNEAQDIEFSIQSTGVTYRCQHCGITSLAVIFDPESETFFAEFVSSEELGSVEEAKKICERTGQNTFFLRDYVYQKPQRKRIHLGEQ